MWPCPRSRVKPGAVIPVCLPLPALCRAVAGPAARLCPRSPGALRAPLAPRPAVPAPRTAPGPGTAAGPGPVLGEGSQAAPAVWGEPVGHSGPLSPRCRLWPGPALAWQPLAPACPAALSPCQPHGRLTLPGSALQPCLSHLVQAAELLCSLQCLQVSLTALISLGIAWGRCAWP